MRAQLSAIVVAHDSGAVLAECVRRLLAATDVLEVLVVDNGSRDGAAAALAPDARLQVLRNAQNPGFAVACNQGARAACGAVLAFVNPDCFVAVDTLTRMLTILDAAPDIGLLGADVRDAHGQPEAAARRRDPTLKRALRHALGASDALHLPSSAALAVQDVDATSGALMLLARAVFTRLGGFDEGYRLHAEDLDLCRRVRGLGLRVAVAEGVQVTHLKGTSSQRRPLFVAFHKHRGLVRYWWRFGAGGGAAATVVAIAAAWLRFAAIAPAALWRQLRAPPPA